MAVSLELDGVDHPLGNAWVLPLELFPHAFAQLLAQPFDAAQSVPFSQVRWN
jgi:hypothetical protein